MFAEIENRDAWFSIRGFVYQVDITIDYWLKLQENEIIELEKGEDIDVVIQNIEKKEIQRDLGQVKFRESNLTLNQEFIVECFYNFYQNKKNNPSKNLVFKFITNSDYGIERPALFLSGESGIGVWLKLSNLESISTTGLPILDWTQSCEI